ncbi:MAG: hypothetical protein FWD61_15140 [Phycisphaerales bacterium]|nr:hypothetical protein [Phycisphaerales bacterium]
MDNPQESPLSVETARRIDALAWQISSANHLDADLHAELRAHIEDKFTAYLTGEIKPSEQDAFLLAEAHFGDPAVIQSLFVRMQPAAASAPSLFARLFTLSIVTLLVPPIVSIPMFFLGIRLLFAIYPAIFQIDTDTNVQFLSLIGLSLAVVVAECLALIAVLIFLRRREYSAQHLSNTRLISRPVAAFAAIGVAMLLPFLEDFLRDFLMSTLLDAQHDAQLFEKFCMSKSILFLAWRILASLLPSTICILAIWFWWIGPTRNRIGTLLATALAWSLIHCLVTTFSLFRIFLFGDRPRHTSNHINYFASLLWAFAYHVLIFAAFIVIVMLFRIIRRRVQNRCRLAD